MALIQGSNVIFVRPTEGTLETSKKTGVDEGGKNVYLKKRYNALTGRLTGVEIKEEKKYQAEGTENKVVLTITDDSDPDNVETYSVKTKEESWFMQNFFAYLDTLDLSQPFKMGASGERAEKATVFCWLKQDGNDKLVKDPNFPVREKVKVGKNEVLDWTPVNDAIEARVKELQTELGHKPTSKPVAVAAVEDEQEIPF